MPDVFDLAIGTIFADPNIAKDALWRVGGVGDGLPVRVVFKTPQEIVSVQETRFELRATLIDVRLADIAAPTIGDTVQIIESGASYTITGLTTIDSARIVQTCEASLQ